MAKSYEDLEVWRKAVDFAEIVYGATKGWPTDERFGLTKQIRRSAVSVAANISEGAERDGTKDFLRFVSIARGSLAETKTFVILARKLDYLNGEQSSKLSEAADEIGRMLSGLSKSLNARLQ